MNGTPGKTLAPLATASWTNCDGLNICRSATDVPCQMSGKTTFPIAYECDSGMWTRLMSPDSMPIASMMWRPSLMRWDSRATAALGTAVEPDVSFSTEPGEAHARGG